MRFDHVGIVVPELQTGLKLFQDHFGVTRWTKPFSDAVNDVHVQFGRDSAGICYELVAPFSDTSPVRRALRTGNNITNHIAYLVSDLPAARARLISADFTSVGEARPAIAYGGRLIQFLMSPIFSLVELIEAPDHEHHYLADEGASLAG